MARHLAPFSWRQRMAEMVRRRSFGAVLPLGRQASISGSSLIQCASVSIAPSSFQEEQNARHHKQFKLEQALILPDEVERWSLTTLREKVVKIGAKVIAHARYTVFQMAEVAVPRELFRCMLDLIDDLRQRRIARC